MNRVGSIFIARKVRAKKAGDPEVRALLKEYLQAIHDGTDTLPYSIDGLLGWVDLQSVEISADCPKRQAARISDRCAAHCPDLLPVFHLPMD